MHIGSTYMKILVELTETRKSEFLGIQNTSLIHFGVSVCNAILDPAFTSVLKPFQF